MLLKGDAASIGLTTPDWDQTLIVGFLSGLILAFLSMSLIEPATEKITGIPHDITIVESIRKNVKNLLRWLFLVWVVVVFTEEIIFRGFLMSEFVYIVGATRFGFVFSVLASAALFGLAHWYQGPAGALSTGIVGIALGALFIWGGTVWLPIMTHGFIDTVSLIVIFFNKDTFFKQLFLKNVK
jgi:membrane protease YdiL (CAAX protease family)